jgi:serine/threonine-protein kinase
MRLAPGDRVKNYRIAEFIGEGGMGKVFLGVEDITERRVAIKMLNNAAVNNPSFKQRFINEARIQASLHHPNIVNLFNFFLEDDEYFMVMEYCDCSTLRDRLARETKLDSRRAREILTAILQGLAHAHSMGIVHRDVKPSNVMFTHENEVKITDFGIARMLGDSHFTQSGQAIGTPHYMSPEQIRNPMGVDTRTDIYSAGVLFFEMLCGKLPFDAASQSQFEIESAIVNNPLPEHALYPFVSTQDWNIIRMMVDKDPNHRPDIATILQLLRESDGMPGVKPAIMAPASNQYHPQETQPASQTYPSMPDYLPEYQEPRKTGKGLLVAGLVILALAVVGLGAYIVISRNNHSQNGSLASPMPVSGTQETSNYTSITITADELRVRAEPGMNSKIVDGVNSGDVVQFMGEKTSWKDSIEINKKVRDEPWLKVITPRGITGWVYGGATSLANRDDDPPAQATAPAMTKPAAPVAPESYRQKSYNRYVTIYVSKYRVRNSPGENAPVSATLNEGDVVTFTGRMTNWTDSIKLRNVWYSSPWIEVITPSGVTGWVFGGGTSFRDEW